MNALHDYVIKMTKDELPPALAFWSVTLYDTKNGWFIPNKENKYSVGQNAGYKLNADGGIEIHIAANKPAGVPPENWLPINREDQGISPMLRLYATRSCEGEDLEASESTARELSGAELN